MDRGAPRPGSRRRTIRGSRCTRARREPFRPEIALNAFAGLAGLAGLKACTTRTTRALFAGFAAAWVALIVAESDACLAHATRVAQAVARTSEVSLPGVALNLVVRPVLVRQIVRIDSPQWRTPRLDMAIAARSSGAATRLDRGSEPPVSASSARASVRVIRGYDAAGPPSTLAV